MEPRVLPLEGEPTAGATGTPLLKGGIAAAVATAGPPGRTTAGDGSITGGDTGITARTMLPSGPYLRGRPRFRLDDSPELTAVAV